MGNCSSNILIYFLYLCRAIGKPKTVTPVNPEENLNKRPGTPIGIKVEGSKRSKTKSSEELKEMVINEGFNLNHSIKGVKIVKKKKKIKKIRIENVVHDLKKHVTAAY